MKLNIAKYLKETRKALGLSQMAFSLQIGYTRDYIASLEIGRRSNPSVRFLERVNSLSKQRGPGSK